MTSLQPRAPYTSEELEQLYPKGLQLQLVQIVSENTLLYILPIVTANSVPRLASPSWYRQNLLMLGSHNTYELQANEVQSLLDLRM
jgi:hypothetical protein